MKLFLLILVGCGMQLAAQPRTTPLTDMSAAIEKLALKVSPAVVKIMVSGYATSDEPNGKVAVIRKRRAIGSGVIVDPKGYIITNAHVVAGAQEVNVVLQPDGAASGNSGTAPTRTVKASIVGTDPVSDIAVLKADATGLPTVPFGDYHEVHQGELVLAFGSPEGLDDTVTVGVVSSVARQPDPNQPMIYIQTDAAVNPGNSGGPLVDVQGRLIGINTFIYSASGGSQGINFAIPSMVASFVYGEILLHGHVHRRALGIYPQPVTPALAAGLGIQEGRGLLIADVVPDGPAAQAGVQIDDVVLQLDDATINSLPDYEAALYRAQHGAAVKLDVQRGSKKLSFPVQVQEEPQRDTDELASLVDPKNSLVRRLGILGVEISGKIAAMLDELRIASGVLVGAMAGDEGIETGLQAGDVIHAVNGKPVLTLPALRSALDGLKSGDAIALQVERDGRLLYLSFFMD